MLASTMQFSNNQPSPATPTRTGRLHETGLHALRRTHVPSGPNSVPGKSSPRSRSTPKQY
jgi:hypothetical protein